MIEPGQHTTIFGMSGCGKSTLTGKISKLFTRKIIFDRLGEWTIENDGNEHSSTVSTYSEFQSIYREFHSFDSFLILIRPRPGMDQEALLTLTNEILSLVYSVETYERQGLAIIFEEVWLYAPLHSIPPWFQETMLTGRHQRISIIANSQRPANVSKTLVSQSRHVFVGQYFEFRDKKYFEECFGRECEIVTNPPKRFTFYWLRPDTETLLVSTN